MGKKYKDNGKVTYVTDNSYCVCYYDRNDKLHRIDGPATVWYNDERCTRMYYAEWFIVTDFNEDQ